MNTQQVILVRESFALVQPIATQAAALFFRRKEGFKDAGQHFGRHPCPCIAKGNMQRRHRLGLTIAVYLVGGHRQAQSAALRHGVNRVQDQVKKHLSQVTGVGPNERQAVRPVPFDLNVALLKLPGGEF